MSESTEQHAYNQLTMSGVEKGKQSAEPPPGVDIRRLRELLRKQEFKQEEERQLAQEGSTRDHPFQRTAEFHHIPEKD